MAVRMRDIKGYEGRYAITEDGRVWSHSSNRFLKSSRVTKTGYYFHFLRTSSYSLSKLVAQAFIPNPDNLPEVRHKDGNKGNNHASNLEWCAYQNSRSNSDKEVAVYCVELDKVFTSMTEASKITGICNVSIHHCCKGTYCTAGGYHWKFVEEVNEK